MDLLSYFRILKRHWVMLLVFVVAGAVLGAATAALSSGGDSGAGAQRSYYKATHTLIFKADNGGSTYPSSFNNLDQIALLATTGPVPEAVAAKRGGSETGQEIAARITTLTDSASGTVAITAVGRQPDDTASLSDAIADQLVASITAADLKSYDTAKTDGETQLATIQGKIDATKAQLAAVPPPANADLLAQQLSAYEEQYSQEFGNYQQIAGKDAPVSPLTTLQKGQAVAIDASEYDTRLAQGRLGQNNLQAGGNAPVAVASSSSGSSIEGPVPWSIFGAFIGLLLGVGFVMLREHLDRRVRSREDAEQAYRWPVLADVPLLGAREQADHDIVASTKAMSPAAEAYRSVRSSVLFQLAAAERDLRSATVAATDAPGNGDGLFEPAAARCVVLMVASATPGEGKTTSSANLAVVFAQAGARVLLVNCDFRRPMLHEYFGLEDLPRRVQATAIPNVHVVTNVVREEDPNPAHVVATQRQVVIAAREKFDVVILDTAPVLGANDAVELMGDVDAVLVVTRSGITRAPAAQRTAESLRRIEAPVAGIVLIGASDPENAYYAEYQAQSRGDAKGRRSRGAKKTPEGGASSPETPPDAEVLQSAGSESTNSRSVS